MKPLVSICIPTYNRADCLKQTIESIICQSEFLFGEVEIVVSDNASTDHTEDICRQYIDYPNFFYHKNKRNIKDENFPNVISLAHGKLRKLNNDTFVLKPCALSHLCSIEKEYEHARPVIFLSNKNGVNKELDFHDFVLDVGFWITWITSFTIWEEDCVEINTDYSGCELQLWQVKKGYEIAHKKDRIVVINIPIGYSISPPQKDISYGLYKIFYCNYMGLLKKYVDIGALSISDIDSLEKMLLFDFFLDWILKYEFNHPNLQYSKEDLKEAIFGQYQKKPYWNEFYLKYILKKMKYYIRQIAKKFLGKE